MSELAEGNKQGSRSVACLQVQALAVEASRRKRTRADRCILDTIISSFGFEVSRLPTVGIWKRPSCKPFQLWVLLWKKVKSSSSLTRINRDRISNQLRKKEAQALMHMLVQPNFLVRLQLHRVATLMSTRSLNEHTSPSSILEVFYIWNRGKMGITWNLLERCFTILYPKLSRSIDKFPLSPIHAVFRNPSSRSLHFRHLIWEEREYQALE